MANRVDSLEPELACIYSRQLRMHLEIVQGDSCVFVHLHVHNYVRTRVSAGSEWSERDPYNFNSKPEPKSTWSFTSLSHTSSWC